jgi:putative glutathione S-transferase
MKGLKKLINMDHIKRHYYGSHSHINPFLIVAKGPDSWWEKPN